jgi:hypothetical protein
VIRDGLGTIDRMNNKEGGVKPDDFDKVSVLGCKWQLPLRRINVVFGEAFSYRWFIPRPYGTIRPGKRRRRQP